MNTTLSNADVASLLQIAGEVGELDRDPRLRRVHILDRLLGLIGGCWAVCSEMDPRHARDAGWSLPDTMTFAGAVSPAGQDRANRYLTGRLAALDPCTPLLLRVGKPVVTARREDVIDRSWYRSEHFTSLRRPLGLGESLYGMLTTPDGRRLKLTLQRELNDPPFTEREVQVLHVFNENLAGLYVATPRVASPAGATPEAPSVPSSRPDARITSLSPRLRPVLQRLLAGDSEKQAALALGLSRHTVHEYVKALHRTFGVNSRGELLSRFVSADALQ